MYDNTNPSSKDETWDMWAKFLQAYDVYGSGPPPVSPPANSSIPTIDNTSPVSGDTLTADHGTWTNSPTHYSYQWKSAGTPVGTDSTTYLTQDTDVGNTITVTVVASNAGGNSSPATSDPTNAVQSLSPPVNVVPPVIVDDGPNGTILFPLTGDTLRCADNGTWLNNPTSFTYQWFDTGGTPISGATNSTLSCSPDLIGSAVKCVVTAHNALGSADAASNESGTIQST